MIGDWAVASYSFHTMYKYICKTEAQASLHVGMLHDTEVPVTHFGQRLQRGDCFHLAHTKRHSGRAGDCTGLYARQRL